MGIPRSVSFFIIYLFSCYEAKEPRTVKITRSDSNLTALPEKPLRIEFEEKNAKNISCRYLKNDGFSLCKDCQYTTSFLDIATVTNDMSTRWECEITLKVDDDDVQNNERKTYEFRMRVKGAKKVNLNIVSNNVTFKNTDLSVEYDGVHKYICEEGYTVDLSCNNNYDCGSITMRYYDAQGNKILESENVNIHYASLTFRQLMTTNYSGSYVDCTYNLMLSGVSQDYTYRTVFTVLSKPARNDNFAVTINNVKLLPTKSASYAYESNAYHYKYMYGEQLTVTCENTKTLGDKVYGRLIDTNQKTIENFTDTTHGVLIDTKPNNLSVFECLSNQDDRSNAYVQFSVGPSPNVLVHGLRASNILLQYSKNNSTMITKYQYTENETINLRCLADNGWTPNWISGDKEIPNYKSGNFTLKAEHNNASITCEAKKHSQPTQTMVIEFQLKLLAEAVLGDDSSSLGVIIGCVVGVLVVVVCAVCGYCQFTKKRVTGEEGGPNINPSQLENNDYTYIEAGDMIENAYYCGNTDYKVPQDNVNSSKNPAESHYTEIGDYCDNTNKKEALTYDVPYGHLKTDKMNQENSNKPYSDLQREINYMQYSNLKNKNSNYENF